VRSDQEVRDQGLHRIVDRHLDRGLGAPQPPARSREPGRASSPSRASAGISSRRTRAGETRIAVRCIVGEFDLRAREGRNEPRFRKLEQRSQPATISRVSFAGSGDERAMAHSPPSPLPRLMRSKHGLGLIIKGVRGAMAPALADLAAAASSR